MIKILSHRGYWKKVEEKNTIQAFENSFSHGFGLETDIRDLNGKLVVSHDIPIEFALSVDELFTLYKKYGSNFCLAINIKSDGLHELLIKLLDEYDIKNYFLFDMSVPDAVIAKMKGLNIFTRQSEYEQTCSLYHYAQGVWMDEFESPWITNEHILEHIKNGKMVCIVSPELHGREYMEKWMIYKELNKIKGIDNVYLCTDFPDKAKDYFYD